MNHAGILELLFISKNEAKIALGVGVDSETTEPRLRRAVRDKSGLRSGME
jgi:hypothetical protein